MKNLNPASAGLLAAGIGVVGAIVGAYLAKSVQARNIEADRKADIYAKVWKFLRETIDIIADVGMATLDVQTRLESNRDAERRLNEISGRLTSHQENATSAQSLDLAGKRELADGLGTRLTELDKQRAELQTELDNQRAALETGKEHVKKHEKQVRKLKHQFKKTKELLSSLNPTLQLTGSRLCLYRYGQVEETLTNQALRTTNHAPIASAAEIQNQSKMADDALQLWTLTARRDNRATRRGGLRLMAFVVRSAWVRGLKR